MSISTISYSESIEMDAIPPVIPSDSQRKSTKMRKIKNKRKLSKIEKKIRMASRGRVCCLGLSSSLALVSLILLTVCLFSASFRNNQDSHGGTKNYGLFRFCYTPNSQSITADDDSNSKMCHLRNYANSQYCQGTVHVNSTRDCFGDFELATIILMSASMGCCLLAVCFSICSIFTSFGALAHSVVLIAAAICSSSGFLAYTYFYELKDNQYELVLGYQYQIHYGWAYYVLGCSALLQWSSFVCSLFGSAFVLVHKNKKRQAKVTSTSL